MVTALAAQQQARTVQKVAQASAPPVYESLPAPVAEFPVLPVAILALSILASVLAVIGSFDDRTPRS